MLSYSLCLNPGHGTNDTSSLLTYLGQIQIKVVNRACSHITTNLGSDGVQTQWVWSIHLLHNTYKAYMVVLLIVIKE